MRRNRGIRKQEVGTFRLGHIFANYTDEWLEFTDDEKQMIEEYRANHSGDFEEGIIFGVIAMEKVRTRRFKRDLQIQFGKMLYSYFVATRMLDNIRMPPLAVPISVVITKDNYIVMGKMNAHTISAGKIQFVGGSLDHHDLDAEGNLSLDNNVKRETMEELAIEEDQIESIQPRLLIQLPNVRKNVVIAYETKLNLTRDQLASQYEQAMIRRETERLRLEKIGAQIPDDLKQEFSELIYIPMNQEGIRQFARLKGEKRMYALSVLRFFCRRRKRENIKKAVKTKILDYKSSLVERDYLER